MLNISMQIIGSSDVANPDPAIHHQVGDVIGIHLTSALTDVVSPSSRLVFVHITDVPILTIDELQFTADPKVSDTPNARGVVPIIHRHEWFLDFPRAAAQELTDLVGLRQVTMPWPRVRQLMVKRTEQRLIEDSDLG